jgi:hypothetical protein
MNKAVSGTFSANGSSNPAQIIHGGVVFVGSAASKNFGSGTVTVEVQAVDGQWYPSSQALTAADVLEVVFQEPSVIRLTLTGSTTPDIDYVIQTDSPVIVE